MKNTKITLKSVAIEAGVSKASVSYAFSSSAATRGKISEGVRRHIEEVAARLGYQPSALARGLAESRSYNIALLLPERCAHNISTHYLEMFHGVSNALQKSDYTLAVYFGYGQKFMGNARNGRIDGVLIVSRLCHADVYQVLRGLELPVVVLNGLPDEEQAYFSSVTNDLEGWLHGILVQMKRNRLLNVHLHLHGGEKMLIDKQLQEAFSGCCGKLGLNGTIFYSDSDFQSSFFVPSCGRIFRGDTPNLRTWISLGMPERDFCSVLLDAHLREQLGIPCNICSYYSSEELGLCGGKMLLEQLSGGDTGVTHRKLPLRQVRGGSQLNVPDYDF